MSSLEDRRPCFLVSQVLLQNICFQSVTDCGTELEKTWPPDLHGMTLQPEKVSSNIGIEGDCVLV